MKSVLLFLVGVVAGVLYMIGGLIWAAREAQKPLPNVDWNGWD